MTKENYKGLLARKVLIDFLPKKLYDIHISEESNENIKETKSWLENDPKLNMIMDFNHISFEDPWYVGYILNKIDPKATRHVNLPVSYAHTKSSTSKAILLPAKLCGMETIRIIQANETKNSDKKNYKPGEIFKNYRNFIERLEEIKDSQQPTAFIISPEGHRSEDGCLGEGNKGIITIAEKLGNTFFVSVGISFNEDFNRSKPNVGRSLNLTVGKPYLYKKGDNIDYHMSKLAETLPEEMRGKWAQMPEIRRAEIL
ncbi:MAG TPA: hypothetical protein PK257_03575 [Candidatus Woesebacteria bacterium]|nr:hypothetical protein [Candidatus Woesebacteria bacterium]